MADDEKARAAALSSTPWERTLIELDLALEQDLAERWGVEIVWRLHVSEDEGVLVVPWAQKVGKKGQRGAASKLNRRRMLLEYGARLTPQDARAAMLLPDGDTLASKALLEALVDHPRLALGDAPDVKAEVDRAKVGLVAEERGASLKVSAGVEGTALPLPLAQRLYRARADEPVFLWDGLRVTLLDAGPELRAALGVLLRDGGVFPPESRGALLVSLSKWASKLPVSMPRSVMGESVPPETRLVVRLEAEMGGEVLVAIRVRPLSGSDAMVPGEGVRDVHVRRGEKAVHAVRNLKAEEAAAAALEGALPLLSAEPGALPFEYRFSSPEGALRLLEACRALEPVPELEWVGQPLRLAGSVGAKQLRVQLEKKRAWFGALGGLSVEGERVELARLLDAARRGDRYVQIEARSFVEIDAALRKQLEALSDHAHRSSRGVEVGPSAAEVLSALEAEGARIEADQDWKTLVSQVAAARALEPQVPAGLMATLRPYQRSGFVWLARLAAWGAGAVLADDMGLGKTVQALALLLDRASLGPQLVVAPTSLSFNWRDEAARFAPSLKVHGYGEAPDRDRALSSLGPGDVLVVSYGLLVRDAKKLAGKAFATVVFDEAQSVKNAATLRARAARALDAGFRVALTGTPVENHLGELWSLFALVFPALLGPWDSFKERFAAPIEKVGDERARRALARVIAPFLLRRTKGEVEAELPEKTEVVVPVSLSSLEWQLYEDARLAALSDLETARAKMREQERRVEVLAALTRLRLLASHPRLYDPRSKVASSKLARLIELVAELMAEGQRTLVFSQFTSHLALVREALDERGVRSVYLDGSTPAGERGERVKQFQEGTAPVFLISLKAGGFGLNLTAATNVVHLDPWWNPAVEDQASDRAHRLGQTRPVTIYRLVALGTIEEQMLSLHAQKRALVAQILEGKDEAARLSADELVELLREGRGPDPDGGLGRPLAVAVPFSSHAMFPTHVQGALAQIFALTPGSDHERAVRARWRDAGRGGPRDSDLPKHLRDAADELSEVLPALTRTDDGIAELCELIAEPGGEVLFSWCSASTWRRDVQLAKILASSTQAGFRDQARAVARSRVIEGPLVDALACVPLLGDVTALSGREGHEARARLEILIWEAGASALEVPQLGPWIWGSTATFDEMIQKPAHTALRGRVLAARCLEISAAGLPASTDPELVGRTLQVLQPLLLHPEPLVWVHAARALGRLTGEVQQLEATLLDWVLSDTKILRQRALTAFASLPAKRLKYLGSQLAPILDSPDEEASVIASLAAATPYLFFDRRDLWDKLAARVLSGSGGAMTARALSRGLAALWRRGVRGPDIEAPYRALREQARSARPTSLEDARRWLEVLAATDPIDLAERDPLDIELGLDNLMRVAAQYDHEEADARAARLAASFVPTFQEARRAALGTSRVRQRAAAMNALEACARAFAFRLWGPLLATHPDGEAIDEPDLQPAWKLVASTPSEILDLVKEQRHPTEPGGDAGPNSLAKARDDDPETLMRLEVLALRLGGYALDACGEDTHLGPGRGPTAHDACLLLRKLEGLSDGSRELHPALQSALSALFWRLVDTTRGTALGEVDDVDWLGPFAAWWGLVIDRPSMLQQLATALPMLDKEALALCCERAEQLRAVVASGAANGAWGEEAAEAFGSLHAGNTELALALLGLADALKDFAVAAGHKPGLEALCTGLVIAGEKLQAALADPVKALRSPGEGEDETASLSPVELENAPRIATLVARAVRARQMSLLDVWFASLGPVASGLLEAAIGAAIRRTPPPPPQPKKNEPKIIEGYELVKPLGQGGIGSVWLVRKPGADRLFVLKIPKAEALAQANEVEREGILASFVEEAKALAGLYHPNVANIIDRGVSNGAPFLVLEYLIGADLKEYATARPMTFFELRQVVLESCAGLAALHNAGLVHRDVKPANLWLRLPLAGGEKFDPAKHRDPAHTPPLATVVIDFGMVRAIRIAADAGGRFVAGTPGYIAPEQVLDPVELDPRSDVYALAASIYNVTTGRAFFDDLSTDRDRIIAHMRRDPFDDPERLRGFPAGIARVLRAATARSPADRPFPLQFGREFAAAL